MGSFHESNELPYGIKLTWFSVAEDKFWTGEYRFDQQKLEALFNRTYNNILFQRGLVSGRRSEFVVNTLPSGLAIIWLRTGGTEKRLVGQFQTQPTEIKWSKVSDSMGLGIRYQTREQLIAATIAGDGKYSQATRQTIQDIRLNKGVYDMTPWHNRMKQYPWQLKISAPFAIKDYLTTYANAERYYTYQNTEITDGTLRPIPIRFTLYIEKPDHPLERLDIDLDVEEVISAFNKLGVQSENMVLYLQLAEDMKGGGLYLQNSRQSIELEKVEVSREKLYITWGKGA